MKEEDAASLSWGTCESPLTPFESPTDGGLIEGAHGCLQVDFANAYIGGGVLNMGNVQVRYQDNSEPRVCYTSLYHLSHGTTYNYCPTSSQVQSVTLHA